MHYKYWVVSLALATLTASYFWIDQKDSIFQWYLFGILSLRGCGGQPMWPRVKSQMPLTLDHAFIEKSIKLLILSHLRAICFCTLHYETPCNTITQFGKTEQVHASLKTKTNFVLMILSNISIHNVLFLKVLPCPFILILSQFYPDFIQISSR